MSLLHAHHAVAAMVIVVVNAVGYGMRRTFIVIIEVAKFIAVPVATDVTKIEDTNLTAVRR